ncbi:VOC family protein [Streptomyces pactum]|uniref:VOC family protein n=1 Tax=Streptomyces pactum TaxID=68249 RepID=A0ABS0NNA8_9ACTN|nr:VOC family protein [Streptomyces pactum]MBH5336684.1 VOC family protein [Streptomyces pactum]
MPEVTTRYAPGTPCWTDLAAPDQQAALDFYAGLFGWSGEIGPPETGGYSVCALRGLPVAGIMAAQIMDDAVTDEPAAPTVWTTYLASDDADATAAAVAAHGGTVHSPVMAVHDLGRMLVAADPTGAVFGVWEAREFVGAGLVNEPNTVIWNELNTTDPATAGAFYRAVFGIEPAPVEDVAGAEGYSTLTVAGRPVGGMQALPASAPPEAVPHWLVYFAVTDPDDTCRRLAATGGTVLQPPFDMVAGRMALVTDGAGAPFAVIRPSPLGETG